MLTATRVGIRELMKLAIFVQDVEIIDVPVEGMNEIVLLRSKKMPEIAFVLWEAQNTGTRFSLMFKLVEAQDGASDPYFTVCSCCYHEHCGQTGPNKKTEEAAQWRMKVKNMYEEALLATCQKYGVKRILLRNAERLAENGRRWGGSWKDLLVYESNEPLLATDGLYERPFAKEAFLFIHPKSPHLIGLYQ